MCPNKSYRAILHVWGEIGQTCAVNATPKTSPTITELACPYLVRQRTHYFYKWIPGNNKPSVYGTNMPTGITVPTTAWGYIGIPSARAQRAATAFIASEYVLANNFPGFGATNPYRRQEAQINLDQDCGANPTAPSVAVI